MHIGVKDQLCEVLAGFMLWGVTLLICFGISLPQAASALETVATKSGKYYTTNTKMLSSGALLDETIINGPPTPPPGFELQRQAVSFSAPNRTAGTNTLPVPAFNWVFGCSAVSGAMIASYYDRSGYPDIYTGPTNRGVMPMDNSSWGTWSDGVDTYPNCPLIASHNGVDGRAIKGSIDDYWIQYGSSASDPYISGAWTQHTWEEAIGDYMKTSQSAYGNSDGSTKFWNYTTSADQLTCADMEGGGISSTDGTYGRKLFYEARGYTVTDCYNQKTDNNGGGFTFAMYKAEIDAGRPVMLNLAGHTVVGVGYDDSANTVYIHDTWDYLNHTMTWGTSYSGMQLQSVSIVNLATPPLSVINTSPADGATGVSPATSVNATFSQDMDASTINTSTFTMDNWVTGTVSYDTSTRTATFTPYSPGLARNTTYTATITTDVATSGGTHLAAPKSWSISIGGPAILLNGDFELGADGSWTEYSLSGYDLVYADDAHAHGGSGYAWLGGIEGGTDVLYQDVAIPADATAAAFQFWYNIVSADTTGVPNDLLTVTVRNPANNAVLQTLVTMSNVNDTSGSYLQSAQYDLSAYKGETIRLTFTGSANSNGLTTNFFLDDVTLQAVEKRTLSSSITGNGSVNSDPTGIGCTTGNSGDCSHLFNKDLTVALIPSAGSGSIINGWSGCTSLSSYNCLVSMTTDKTATATFIVTPSARIFGLGGYTSLQDAYNAAATGNTIQARAMELPDDSLTLDLGKTVLIEGGYDSSYSSNSGGYTTMTGVLTLETGVLTVENLIIK